MSGSSAEDKVANWLARDDSSLRFTLAMLADVAERWDALDGARQGLLSDIRQANAAARYQPAA